MSLSPIKVEILQTMLLLDKPMKAMDIAKESHKEFQPVMMHLLGLQRMGYIASPEKGLYHITSAGKKTLGIPEITKEKATAILSYSPHEKSFHFYATVGQPLSMHAHNLRDFVGKIEKADVISVDFHFKRGDFENWFKGLGDEELIKKTVLLKQRNTSGEPLRKQLHDIVERRYRELSQLSGQVFPEDEHGKDNASHNHPC
jgi:hypothetical protein